MKNKKIVFSIVFIGLLVLLDQFTKILADRNLNGKPDFEVISGILSFSYLENTGAAWGIFAGKRMFFLIISVVMILAIVFFIYRIEKSGLQKKTIKWLQFDLLILLAGAIGNLIDRAVYGYVIDFIQADFISFPTFNVADCYVTVSCAVLFVILLFFVNEEELDRIL